MGNDMVLTRGWRQQVRPEGTGQLTQPRLWRDNRSWDLEIKKFSSRHTLFFCAEIRFSVEFRAQIRVLSGFCTVVRLYS